MTLHHLHIAVAPFSVHPVLLVSRSPGLLVSVHTVRPRLLHDWFIQDVKSWQHYWSTGYWNAAAMLKPLQTAHHMMAGTLGPLQCVGCALFEPAFEMSAILTLRIQYPHCAVLHTLHGCQIPGLGTLNYMGCHVNSARG